MRSSTIRVRMYNTGFGDCFLLTFAAQERPLKVLIDCGKHSLCKTGPNMERVVQQVITDLAEESGPRVDLIVATHRHQDHVSGFASNKWNSVSVSEVWMPWTENPADPLAREICGRQSTKANKLKIGIQKLGLGTSETDYLLAYAGNNLTNTAAMRILHQGFEGRPLRRFLPDKPEQNTRLFPSVLPGVEVFVLGPSHDPKVLKEMDPPGAEAFLRSWEMATQNTELQAPFHDRWCVDRQRFNERYRRVPDDCSLDDEFPVTSEGRLAQIFDDPVMELAAGLEQAVNSTSLVLLFHMDDLWLLFAGDAQWGTWNNILQDQNCARLFENLSFYKVGHHGSHNGTPKSFVERYVTEKTVIMVPYGKVDKWPSIPRLALLDRFRQKRVALARSDAIPSNDSRFECAVENKEVLYIDAVLPF